MKTVDLTQFPTLDEQIAAIPPGDDSAFFTLYAITLPSGETIDRLTFDGVPFNGVSLSRGRVMLALTPSGGLDFMSIGDMCIDDVREEELENIPALLESIWTCSDDDEVTAEDYENLRTLFSFDLVQLGTLAMRSPEVEHAIEDWYALPYEEMRAIAQTIGFGAWYSERRHLLAA